MTAVEYYADELLLIRLSVKETCDSAQRLI